MLPSIILLGLTAIFPSLAWGAGILQEITNAHATVYYDLTNSLCGNAAAGDPFTANWAETSGINGGIPFCQGQTAKTLKQLGTNRIVALRRDWVIGNPAEYCGKEVQIIQANGEPMVFDEGPFFIWDGCEACVSTPIIDVSAKAFVQLKGGSCAGNNPGGLTVRVLDNNIWEAGSGGDEGGTPQPQPSQSPAPSPPPIPPRPSSLSSSSSSSSSSSANPPKTGLAEGGNKSRPTFQQKNKVVNTVSPTTSSSSTSSAPRLSATGSTTAKDTAVRTIEKTSSPEPTFTSGHCVFGDWRCNGLTLQVCNRVALTQLGWETIHTCPSVCEIAESGSVDCE